MLFDGKKRAARKPLFDEIRRYIDEKYDPQREEIRDCFTYDIVSFRQSDDACYDMSVGSAPRGCASVPAKRASMPLEEYIKQKDASFSESLASMIQQRGLKNSAVYKKAHLSKQHFSKIINDPDARPSKATAVSLAIGLELDLEQTQQFIGKAGYVLSDSSVFDLIIRYFIEKKIYDVIEINFALYEFDQPLLGA